MLVAVLSGVFDPPPAALAVPWGYLAGTLALAVAAVAAVIVAASRALQRARLSGLREL
jgi:putative ABC transport system permease protein